MKKKLLFPLPLAFAIRFLRSKLAFTFFAINNNNKAYTWKIDLKTFSS